MRVLWSLVVSWVIVVQAQDQTMIELGKNVLEWIHESDGGYVHPDQEFRVDPESGVAGLFATDFIPKGTVLCQVPWSLIIESDDPDEEGQMCCGTVRATAREMKRGNRSAFAPYVKYLNEQSHDDVPSAWSAAGQKLLRELTGGKVKDPDIPPEEPTEWLSYDWYGRCRGKRTDALSAKAAIVVLQRSDDNLLIPGTCLRW